MRSLKDEESRVRIRDLVNGNTNLRQLLKECEDRLLEVSKTLYVLPGAITKSAFAVSGGSVVNLREKISDHLKKNVELIDKTKAALK